MKALIRAVVAAAPFAAPLFVATATTGTAALGCRKIDKARIAVATA